WAKGDAGVRGAAEADLCRRGSDHVQPGHIDVAGPNAEGARVDRDHTTLNVGRSSREVRRQLRKAHAAVGGAGELDAAPTTKAPPADVDVAPRAEGRVSTASQSLSCISPATARGLALAARSQETPSSIVLWTLMMEGPGSKGGMLA